MQNDNAVIAVFDDHKAADAAVEGAVVVGGIGAALTNIGVPKDSVLSYETAIKGRWFSGDGPW